MQTFSPSPGTERRPPRLPHHKSQTLNQPEPQLASIVRKAPSSPKQVIPQPSPGILIPHQQRSPNAPFFRPNATRAIEQDSLGGSPYSVSKIIPQREGFLLFSDLTPQGRRPREGQLGRDEGLVPQSFRRGQKASPHEVRSEAFCMPEDDWGTKPSSLPGICSESEYPCCYSALPTELRLVMRILTSSVISRIPSLAGFLGSKQAGFSAM